MMIHKQKIAWIESEPVGWPDGWEFGPGLPLPPGFGKNDFGMVVLAGVATGSVVPLLEVWTLDKYAEDTDALAGQVLVIRAYDGDKPVRLKTTRSPALPWSEQVILKIREYEPGKFGVLENLAVDRERMVGEKVRFVYSVWGSFPVVDGEVTA